VSIHLFAAFNGSILTSTTVDAEEQQKRLEEQLRRRYEEDFERSRNGTPVNPGQASTAASASAPASSAPVAQQQPQKSILDEYDPFRA
jgi:hypothetical protein